MTPVEIDHAAFLRRIRRERIVTPGDGQYVDQCHYSKTGWAVWDKDGACTCKPAKAPSLPGAMSGDTK